MPQIAVINESTNISDAEVQSYLPAFGHQWNQDLLPVWGVDAATFAFVPPNQAPASGTWWVVFLDDSDQAGALAYHDLTDEGLPISKVFVKTIKADNASVSVGATHEICEMAVDPWLNSAYQDPHGIFWAGEVCDPVEDDQYGYEIDGVLVTDFVTPNWFGYQHAQSTIDLKGHAHAPFEILTGGCAQKFDSQAGWQQVTSLWRGAAIEWPMPRMGRAESGGLANGRAAIIPAPMSARSNYAPTRCAAAYLWLGPECLKRDPGAREPRPCRDDGHERSGRRR